MFTSVHSDYKPKFYVTPENVKNELSKHILADGFDLIPDLYASSVFQFIDARSGDKYLDFFTCFASLPLGMNHPKMTTPEFIEYMGKIALNKPSNSDLYTDVMATFVKTFFELGDVNDFKYAFFISGGALAVCNALKTAFDWKVRKNFRKGYRFEKGHKIIHFKDAFHGREGYTMSLTNTDPIKTDYFPKFDWPRITNPYIEFPLDESNLNKVIQKENLAIQQIKKAFIENKDDIAAIIIEPIQGEGGDNHFRKEFLSELRNLADENDCLLIFDEIQTGVGITGKMWAYKHTDIAPDIMCFGKKMQICGIVVSERIDEVPDNVFHVSSRLNSTWGGNIIDMARATRYLEIIAEDNLVENAKVLGEQLLNELLILQIDYPELISNVRGKGLFCAFDLPNKQTRDKFKNLCYDNKLLILGCGNKSIRFRPPLNIDYEHLREGMKIIRTVLNELKK